MYRRLILCCVLLVIVLFLVPQFSASQTPAPPAFSLSVVPTDTGRGFKLNWTAPTGVVVNYYLVYRAAGTNPDLKPDSLGFGSPRDTVKLNIDRVYRDFPLASLTGGYFYIVRARTLTGVSLASNILFVGLPPMFQLNAYPIDSGKVKLNWNTPPGFAVNHYQIFRALVTATGDTAQFTRVDSVSPRNEYIDKPSPLTNGGAYAYSVVAISNTPGQILKSNIAFVYFPPTTPPENFRLTAMLDTSGGKKTAKLEWVAPTNVSVQKYTIFRAPFTDGGAPIDPTKWVVVKDSTTGALSYRDTLAPGSVGGFAYYIRAKTGAATFINSNLAGVYIGTPAAIQYIKLEGKVLAGKPRLEWSSPEGSAFSWYYIYRAPVLEVNPAGNTSVVTFLDSTTSTTYTDTTALASSGGFAYRVRGKTENRFVESNIVTIILFEKLLLTAYSDFGGGSIKLNWTEPQNQKPLKYLVYRYPVTDSLGRTPDTTKWVLVVDSTLNHEYNDKPALPTLSPGLVLRGFAYFVRAIMPVGFLQTNIALVPWHPPVAVPFTLFGRLESNGVVKLEWNQPSGFTPTQYILYRATLARNTSVVDTTQFAAVDTTTNKSITNSPPLASSNSFAYYVRANGPGGQSVRTNHMLVFIQIVTQDRVVIVSEPNRHGRVGQAYTYQPKAFSTDSTAQLKWLLRVKPTGMTIDSIGGLIQWTPTVKGWFKIALAVVSSKGSKAEQEFEVAIAGGFGVVKGVVTDTLGNPVLAVVKLFKRDITTPFEYRMVTDSTGAYSFADVDVGSYIAYAAPILGDYIPQWYYDKNRPDQATPIVVADSSTVTANFRLRSRSATIPMWNITGRVTDTLNAKIQGALVIFARAEFILNSAKNLGASEQQSENFREIFKDLLRYGAHSVAGNFQLVFRTVTDTGGRYSIRLPQGPYIGISFAQGFRKMFYNNKTDLLSADLLRLSKDTANINFSLIPLPAFGLGSISGTVYDTSSGVSVPARIIAFRDKSDRKRVDSYYAETDTGGVYSLTELPPGEYRVLAIPLGNYVPSFYSLTGPTLRWKLATKITVSGNDVSGINVYVRQIPRLVSGYTYIQGTVNTNASFGGSRYGKSAVVGVNGSMVYAVASDGSVAGYGVSDATGSYSISGISPQTYTVYNDRMGFNEPIGTTSSPSYDPSGNPQPSTANFDIVETTTDVEGTVVEIPTEYRLEQNYPNPFNPTTRIAFSIPKTEHVTIAVFNILGQKVATVVDRNFDAGTFTVSWNARNESGVPLATGVYLYRITTSEFSTTRKMILLK